MSVLSNLSLTSLCFTQHLSHQTSVSCDCFDRYGFGVEGRPKYDIGPNADVVYEVTLKDFVKVFILTFYLRAALCGIPMVLEKN